MLFRKQQNHTCPSQKKYIIQFHYNFYKVSYRMLQQYNVPGNEASDVHWLEYDAESQARVF